MVSGALQRVTLVPRQNAPTQRPRRYVADGDVDHASHASLLDLVLRAHTLTNTMKSIKSPGTTVLKHIVHKIIVVLGKVT